MKTFWMLYAEGKSSPTLRHFSYESALNEATRLAQELGTPVYILRAVEVARLKTVEVGLLEE